MKSNRNFQSLKSLSSRIIELNDRLDYELARIDSHFIAPNDDEDHLYDLNYDDAHNENDCHPQNIDIYKDIGDDRNDYSNKPSHKELIVFKNVRIETPNQSKLLLNKFNFCVKMGQNVLIVGPNGSGKSSLVRVISGLWKNTKGSIQINKNCEERIYFLPSRSYLIPNLSIKEQILYPDICNEQSVSDEAVIEVLNDCGLGKLCEYTGIESINDNACISEMFWSNMSDGERQLISLCRALIKKPPLLIIDEAINNLDPSKIEWFFNELSKLNITCITISHSITDVKKYHHIMLKLSGDGSGNYSVQMLA